MIEVDTSFLNPIQNKLTSVHNKWVDVWFSHPVIMLLIMPIIMMFGIIFLTGFFVELIWGYKIGSHFLEIDVIFYSFVYSVVYIPCADVFLKTKNREWDAWAVLAVMLGFLLMPLYWIILFWLNKKTVIETQESI